MARLRPHAAARPAGRCRRCPPRRASPEGRGRPLRPRQLQGARRRLRGGHAAAGRARPHRRRAVRRHRRPRRRHLPRGDAAITVTCATDGNHGRAVAWGAQRFGAAASSSCTRTVSQGRASTRSPATAPRYAACPAPTTTRCARPPARPTRNGWFVVSDTSWPGYTEVPRDIMQGYRLMADEAADQWTGPPPTHVFIQGGVGGVGGGGVGAVPRPLLPRAGAGRGGTGPRRLPARQRRAGRAHRHPRRPGHA